MCHICAWSPYLFVAIFDTYARTHSPIFLTFSLPVLILRLGLDSRCNNGLHGDVTTDCLCFDLYTSAGSLASFWIVCERAAILICSSLSKRKTWPVLCPALHCSPSLRRASTVDRPRRLGLFPPHRRRQRRAASPSRPPLPAPTGNIRPPSAPRRSRSQCRRSPRP